MKKFLILIAILLGLCLCKCLLPPDLSPVERALSFLGADREAVEALGRSLGSLA